MAQPTAAGDRRCFPAGPCLQRVARHPLRAVKPHPQPGAKGPVTARILHD